MKTLVDPSHALAQGLAAIRQQYQVPPDFPPAVLAAAEAAAADFLRALGITLDSEHLRATPGRMARAWAEMLTPRPFELTTFPNEEDYDELGSSQLSGAPPATQPSQRPRRTRRPPPRHTPGTDALGKRRSK